MRELPEEVPRSSDARMPEPAPNPAEAERRLIEAEREAERRLIEAERARRDAILSLSTSDDEILALNGEYHEAITRSNAAHEALGANAAHLVAFDDDSPIEDEEVIQDAFESELAALNDLAGNVLLAIQRLIAARTRLAAAEKACNDYDHPRYEELLDQRSRMSDVEDAVTDVASDLMIEFEVHLDSFGEENAEAWREARESILTKGGDFGLALVGFSNVFGSTEGSFVEWDRLRAVTLAAMFGLTVSAARQLEKRVRHVAPESLFEGLTIDDAVTLKDKLGQIGIDVKVAPARPQRDLRSLRQPIPERVRHEVWRRDQGRCVECGSRERLEFDHIIPLSKGGSNTARNIELRCEEHNRAKSDKI